MSEGMIPIVLVAWPPAAILIAVLVGKILAHGDIIKATGEVLAEAEATTRTAGGSP